MAAFPASQSTWRRNLTINRQTNYPSQSRQIALGFEFFERLELSVKQMLSENSENLIAQPGMSAQLFITYLEGNVSRYIRSKFKDSPSNYIENMWELISLNIFKN